jgi:hypothetical protein
MPSIPPRPHFRQPLNRHAAPNVVAFPAAGPRPLRKPDPWQCYTRKLVKAKAACGELPPAVLDFLMDAAGMDDGARP